MVFRTLSMVVFYLFITYFSTAQSCLIDKTAGQNPTDTIGINATYNQASPFSYRHMLGFNNGGGIMNTTFSGTGVNPISSISTSIRSFHMMDRDFGFGLPKNDPTDPSDDGIPNSLANQVFWYNQYADVQGITEVSAALENLITPTGSWKDKIFNEDDWADIGHPGITQSMERYFAALLNYYSPPGCTDCKITSFEIGNEPWDYPFESDYHQLIEGARNALYSVYGPNKADWKVKIVSAAFQARYLDSCDEEFRNSPNCGNQLRRFDFVGNYLDLECDVADDLHAINFHAYSFLPGSLDFTFPENQDSEFNTIKNMIAWRDINFPGATRPNVWSTEFGFDSDNTGEITQGAYMLRGLLIHSRYHIEKLFFYNGFDFVTPDNGAYGNLFQSTGVYTLGPDPSNPASSGKAQYGAPKSSFYVLEDFMNQFDSKIFQKALVENDDLYAYLLTESDGSGPYIIYWDPSHTEDTDIFDVQASATIVDWSGVLGGDYIVENTTATFFKHTAAAAASFSGVMGSSCNQADLVGAHMPAFIKLVECPASCPAPQNVSVTVNSETMAYVQWNDVAEASQYKVRFKPVANSNWVKFNRNTNNVSLGGLMPNTDYEFQVQSLCPSEDSDWTASTLFTTTVSGNSCPIPSNVVGTILSDTQMRFDWDAESAANNYKVRFKLQSASSWIAFDRGTNNVTLSGLINGENYEFEVRSQCNDGNSDWSSTYAFVMTMAPQNCNIPTNVNVSINNATTAYVTWDNMPDAASYKVRFKQTSASNWIKFGRNTNNVTLGGLATGVEYEFQVHSICTNGDVSDWTSSVLFSPSASSNRVVMDNNLNKINSNFYPNPFVDYLNVTLSDDFKNLEVRDINNRIVYKTDRVTNRINLSELNAGIYFVLVFKEEGLGHVEKVLKL